MRTQGGSFDGASAAARSRVAVGGARVPRGDLLLWRIYARGMSVTGKVKNGVVVLAPGTKLPEGAEVRVETLKSSEEDDPLVAAIGATGQAAASFAKGLHAQSRLPQSAHYPEGILIIQPRVARNELPWVAPRQIGS